MQADREEKMQIHQIHARNSPSPSPASPVSKSKTKPQKEQQNKTRQNHKRSEATEDFHTFFPHVDRVLITEKEKELIIQ